MNETLYAHTYGAVGDGIADDGPAITAAVKDAIEKQATLLFEAGKTYRIVSGGEPLGYFRSPFMLKNADHVTIDGAGAKFLFTPEQNYFLLERCGQITIKNMIFDLTETVYLVGRVKSVQGARVVYDVDREPTVDFCDYSGVVAFSIKYNEGTQHRPHRFITEMKKEGDREVSVLYTDEGHGYAVGDLVFVPNPGVGHLFTERIFIFGQTAPLHLTNLSIYAGTHFLFNIRANTASIHFDRVNMIPDPDDKRQIKMVAWRDGYHCKDNRAPIHWSRCRTDVLFDDVFNVRATLGYVKKVFDDGTLLVSNDEFERHQHRTIPYDGMVGDIIDIYDYDLNLYCGRAKIAAIENDESGASHLTLEAITPLSGIKEGSSIGNHETCAPGSTICDSVFTGTFRFARDITIERCRFDHLHTWLMAEGDVEGPIPGNIVYRDCDILGGNMEIGSKWDQIAPLVGPIDFVSCRIETMNCIYAKGVTIHFEDSAVK